MKLWFFALLAMLIGLVACSNDEPAAPPDVSGPALIMFYTDN